MLARLLQDLELLDHPLGRTVARASPVHADHRAEVAVEAAAARGLEGVQRGVAGDGRSLQEIGPLVRHGHRVHSLPMALVQALQAPGQQVVEHGPEDSLAFTREHGVGVSERLARQEGRVDPSQQHGHALLPVGVGQPVRLRGDGGPDADGGGVGPLVRDRVEVHVDDPRPPTLAAGEGRQHQQAHGREAVPERPVDPRAQDRRVHEVQERLVALTSQEFASGCLARNRAYLLLRSEGPLGP
jgi:hypothetical protein